MENILIKGKHGVNFIPTVDFNAGSGICELAGESYLEDTIEFYSPIFNWLKQYTVEIDKPITFNFRLRYFNTSSSKCILDVFKKLETIYKDENDVVINWYYEEDDEDMLEAGEDYQSILKIPFKMIEMEE